MPNVLVLRAGARQPKSKTGCVSCKRRHLKCDEGEPACRRCQKAGLLCDYANAKAARLRDSRSHRQLAPAPLAAAAAAAPSKPKLLERGRPQSGIPVFGVKYDTKQAFYHDVFRCRVLPRLVTQGQLSDFWSRTVLRESIHDPCIRDCIVALGALDRATHRRSGAAVRPPLCAPFMASTTNLLDEDHAQGLQHYAAALSQFRTRMARGGQSMLPRDLVIVSILFILVESTHGDGEAVDRLFTSIMLVLKDKVKDPKSPPLKSLGGVSIARAVDDLGLQQADDFLTRAASFRGLCSPQNPTNPLRWTDGLCLRSDLLNMPFPTPSSTFEQVQCMWDGSFARVTKWFVRVYRVLSSPGSCPDDLEEVDHERKMVLSHCGHWAALAQAKWTTETSRPSRSFWQIVWARARVNYLFTSVLLDVSECGWDGLVEESHELLDRVDDFVEEHSSYESFGCLFDDQVIPVVSCVVVKCRNYEVRQKGLILCRRLIDSNRTWQNITVLMRLEAACAAEERSRDENGFIPVNSRYWAPTSHWDPSFTHMTLKNRRVGMDTDDEIVMSCSELERLLAKPGIEGFASITLRLGE